MFYSVVFFFLMAFSGLLYAEEAHFSSDHKVSGKVEFGGFKTAGNTETETLDGKIKVHYIYQDWSSEFSFEGTQTSDKGVLTSEYYEAELKGKYELPNQTYIFLLLGYKEDFFGGIISEVKQLGGLGYHAFDETPGFSIDLELGYGVRDGRKVITTKLDHDPGTHGALFAQYAWSEDDIIKLDLLIEKGNDDDFIKKELSWVHTLFDDVSFDLSYVTRTVTSPEVGKKPTDSKLSVKFGYEF